MQTCKLNAQLYHKLNNNIAFQKQQQEPSTSTMLPLYAYPHDPLTSIHNIPRVLVMHCDYQLVTV